MNLLDLIHHGPVVFATFLASFVEFVEALTIVLAVGTARNWRSALWGSGLAAVALALVIALGSPALRLVPLRWMQLVIGFAVLIFGLRWLKKATLRSAGRVPMHDEDLEYSNELRTLGSGRFRSTKIDKIAVATTFKAVFLEGFEVAFIVLTAGSIAANLIPAMIGASAAFVMVISLGVAIHKPLSRVPENALKKTVGILLSSFGTFWFTEGLGHEWPLGEFAILGLAFAFTLISLTASRLLQSQQY